jgi:Cu+-exporting ATPase
MAIDPICGMTVAESSPLRAERDGQTYCFCSKHCRKMFIAQAGKEQPLVVLSSNAVTESANRAQHGQARHSHGAAQVKPSAAAKYFCPMCPRVESETPGDCPKCGMALERNPAWQDSCLFGLNG